MRYRARRLVSTALASIGLAAAVALAPAPSSPVPVYEGFGADTPGGSGQKVVHVTTLADSGPGSLREALAAGHRTIVFDVAGDIDLESYLFVNGPYVTIDGLSAPEPGITLRGRGLVIRGTRGAHDVVVRGLRVRGAEADGIQVAYEAARVVLDHVSVWGSGDENLGLTFGARDVTVSWSILGGNPKNVLIKYGTSRVTLHHNLFADSKNRNPQVRIDDDGGAATDTTIDMRNNVIARWGIGSGTLIWHGPWANAVGNYYVGRRDIYAVKKARAYAWGNITDRGKRLRKGRMKLPFPAPPVTTTDPCTAVPLVLAEAGVHPRDDVDAAAVADIAVTTRALKACRKF